MTEIKNGDAQGGEHRRFCTRRIQREVWIGRIIATVAYREGEATVVIKRPEGGRAPEFYFVVATYREGEVATLSGVPREVGGLNSNFSVMAYREGEAITVIRIPEGGRGLNLMGCSGGLKGGRSHRCNQASRGRTGSLMSRF